MKGSSYQTPPNEITLQPNTSRHSLFVIIIFLLWKYLIKTKERSATWFSVLFFPHKTKGFFFKKRKHNPFHEHFSCTVQWEMAIILSQLSLERSVLKFRVSIIESEGLYEDQYTTQGCSFLLEYNAERVRR